MRDEITKDPGIFLSNRIELWWTQEDLNLRLIDYESDGTRVSTLKANPARPQGC